MLVKLNGKYGGTIITKETTDRNLKMDTEDHSVTVWKYKHSLEYSTITSVIYHLISAYK